jgi:hypothetical protein
VLAAVGPATREGRARASRGSPAPDAQSAVVHRQGQAPGAAQLARFAGAASVQPAREPASPEASALRAHLHLLEGRSAPDGAGYRALADAFTKASGYPRKP